MLIFKIDMTTVDILLLELPTKDNHIVRVFYLPTEDISILLLLHQISVAMHKSNYLISDFIQYFRKRLF